MNSPNFSIVVPVYNVEQYLEKCINSVLSQTYQDFELILVDDGSKDSSGMICDRFAQQDARIKVIHKQNAGVSVARNIGIEQAKGKFICFIDSDDWIEKTYLQQANDEISDFDILFFGSMWHYEDGSSRSLSARPGQYRYKSHEAIIHLLENDIYVNYFGFTWNKIFRRDIIEKFDIRFIESLAISEDEVFTLAYCNHIHSLRIIEAPLYHYLWKSQGLTHKIRKANEWLLLADSFLNLINGIQCEKLARYYKIRIACIYNTAAWLSRNPFGWLKEEMRMIIFCLKNNVSIPVKAIGREMINKII